MQKLDDAFWSNRYSTHTDAWDIGQVAPPLKEYIDQLTNKNVSILIPGCGNAYEAAYLHQQGFTDITLIDISKELIKKIRKQFDNTPIKIIHADFFDQEGKYDLILEHTFFCALNPTLRHAYAKHMRHLLATHGTVAGLLFNCSFESNPPFGGYKAEYEHLFAPLFSIKTMAPCYNSIIPRQNRELFFILKS
jgi:SAM-dependent methyltransferase